MSVKKTLTIKLVPDASQEAALKKTIETFREVCDYLSEKAFESKKFNKVVLQRATYKECREKFGNFSSQLVVRAISVVCDSYRLDKRTQHYFTKSSAVYDARVLSWKGDTVSLWTVDGRLTIPMQVWNQELFGKTKGEVDLLFRKGKWMLSVSIECSEEKPFENSSWLGVDLGIVNIATTSDGVVFSGKAIEDKRKKYSLHRQRLQIRNTKSSRRKIRKTGKREARFRKDVNHVISNKIVCTAKGTYRGIAIENLKGIRERTTVRREQRSRHNSWGFFQLRQFIQYKALEKGVPVRLVDSRNTSKGCSVCGHIDSRNRKSQSKFCCVACGHNENADFNASKNISFRAAVNQPIASHSSCKPTALAVGS
jgi:IS605 OrfB family transposase